MVDADVDLRAASTTHRAPAVPSAMLGVGNSQEGEPPNGIFEDISDILLVSCFCFPKANYANFCQCLCSLPEQTRLRNLWLWNGGPTDGARSPGFRTRTVC